MPQAPKDERRIRVLQYTVSLGGVRRHLEYISAQIDHSRFEIIGAFPNKQLDRNYLGDDSESYRNMFARRGLQSYTVETPVGLRLWPLLQSLVKMIFILREVKPDVLHCHSSIAGAIGRLASLFHRVPLLVYTPHLMFCLRLTGLKGWIFATIEKLLLPLCDTLLAVSSSEYHSIREVLGDRPQIKQINNSIPIDMEKDISSAKDWRLYEELNVSPETILILSTARFDAQKDVPTLIRAAAQLYRKRSDFVVLLAGDSEQRLQTEELVHAEGALDCVRFLGWRSDVDRLVCACDIMVLASHLEGLPYALLEAMAVEKPVVGSNVMGVRDCVEHGVTGFLFPDGDASALAGYLERLLDDAGLRRSMGAAGKDMAMREFSPRTMIDSLEKLYSQQP